VALPLDFGCLSLGFWNPQEQHAPGFLGESSVLHVKVLLEIVKMCMDSPFDRGGLLPSKNVIFKG
jgi:hypothetical protein